MSRAVERTTCYAYYGCQLGLKTRKQLCPIPQPILAYQSMIIIIWKLLVKKRPCTPARSHARNNQNIITMSSSLTHVIKWLAQCNNTHHHILCMGRDTQDTLSRFPPSIPPTLAPVSCRFTNNFIIKYEYPCVN